MDPLAVMLIGEQVSFDGGALLYGWRQRMKSGQHNFTNHRVGWGFSGRPQVFWSLPAITRRKNAKLF